MNAPVGLEIGALTPDEIAISIAAELIAVRRGATDVAHKASSKDDDARRSRPSSAEAKAPAESVSR